MPVQLGSANAQREEEDVIIRSDDIKIKDISATGIRELGLLISVDVQVVLFYQRRSKTRNKTLEVLFKHPTSTNCATIVGHYLR